MERDFFISHADGELIIVETELRTTLPDGKLGWFVKKIYIDEEGMMTLLHKKKKSTKLGTSSMLSDERRVIKAIFDSKYDSWH